MALSVVQIRKIKPPSASQKNPDKYSDGAGLQLHVSSTGRMTWIYAYRFNGKQCRLTIGNAELISLEQARLKRTDAQKLLLEGINPSEAKKAQKAKDSGENSFKAVATEWYNKKSPEWSESTKQHTLSRLESDIFPYIGSRDISEITAPELLKVIQRIESRSIETAYKVLGHCGQIFRYGRLQSKNANDPSHGLREALAARRVKHFAAITDPSEVGGLLRAIEGFNGTFVVKCALQLAPLWFCRPGELRTTKWSEIDFDNAERRYFVTKTKQEHIIPLSKQALEILRELKKLTGKYEYVFIGLRDKHSPMSNMAVNAALRRMGFDTKEEMTGHGFRAMARTILHERLGVERDVIEHQLAHAVGDALGTAYNRTKFLAQRKVMMQQWADYLDGLRNNVIEFPNHQGCVA